MIVECDGEPIPLPSLQGIVVLNISSFMGGTNFWGSAKEDNIFLPPSFDDGILEVHSIGCLRPKQVWNHFNFYEFLNFSFENVFLTSTNSVNWLTSGCLSKLR